MADATETRALLLQINATTELLRSELTAAEKSVAAFHSSTTTHLDDMDKRWEGFGKAIEKLEGPLERVKALGEVAVAALIGESLVERGKQALEFAGNIQFMANQIGVSTAYLQQFNYAAGQYGVSTEVADTALTKFTRTIGEAANGNKEAIELFDRLGVKIFDSGGKLRSVQSIAADFANGIQKIESPAQRTSDTMQAFGRGAAGLAPLLAQGAEGFQSLAEAAEQLHVVLSPELIEHSEQVNHKLASLKQVLDAQMASAVAENATSILQLATALERLAVAAANAAAKHPAAVTGVVAGLAARIIAGGGPVGTVLAIGTGVAAAGAANSDSEPVLRARLKAVRGQIRQGIYPTDSDAYKSLIRTRNELQTQVRAFAPTGAPHEEQALGSDGAGATNNSGQDLKTAQAALAGLEKQKVGASGAALVAYNKEIAEKQAEIGFIKQGATAEMAKTLAARQGAATTKGENDAKKARAEAEEQRKKLVEDNIQFETEQLRLQKSILDGKAHTAANDADRDKLEKQIIDETAKTLADQIAQRRDNVVNDPKASQARKDAAIAHANILLGLNETDRAQKDAKVDIDRQLDTQKQAVDKAALELQGQIDLVGLQDQLAVTREQRLKYELQLLELQRQAAVKAQQDIIDAEKLRHPKEADQDKNIIGAAQTRIGQINAAYPLQQQAVQRQNADPLQAYTQQLHQNTDSMSDALQGIEVGGLKDLEDEFGNVVTGSEKASAAVKKMVLDMIEQFAKLELEKGILAILGAFGGGAAGGASKGYAADGLYYADGGVIPAFASGGLSGLLSGPGGPRDDAILARLSAGEFIMNAASTKKYLPMLHAMNDNRLPGFADGGQIGSISMPSISSEMLRAGARTTIHLGDNHLYAPGADPAALARLQSAFEQSQREMPARVIAAVSDAQDRRLLGRG